MNLDLSVVIPVFGTGGCLEELYFRIKKALDQLSLDFEIIFIDDCGSESSWTVIQSLSSIDCRVRGALLSRNFGQHNALLAGIRMAEGPLTVTMDDDLQHPPEEISKLFAEIMLGFDVVYGCPRLDKHGFFRNIASQGTKLFLEKYMGANAARNISSFRIFKTDLRDAFEKYNGSSTNIDVLMTWGTNKFSAVKVKHDNRKLGQSSYTLSKLVSHALNMLLGFSSAPLKITGLLGIIFSIIGFIMLGYVLVTYLVIGGVVPGFGFLASIILLFSGVQLLALGIIGEYLSRVYERSMGGPTYIFREILNNHFNY